jgi:ABC-type transport system involved in multi-copper enzyme maturation permease subunit
VNATVVSQMLGAEFLKLRKKRGTVVWATVLALGPLIVFFAVNAIQHSSNPGMNEPAGGTHGFTDSVRILGVFLGPLAAILIGAEAGATDTAAGVFRDLVSTGRSRLSLFAVRTPAALMLSLPVIFLAYVIAVIGTFVFAAGLPTPDAALLANGLGFVLLSNAVVCVVAVGLASLTNSRPATLTVLIGWQLVASRLIASASTLGSSRDAILSQALVHFSPVGGGERGAQVSMSIGVAVIVLAGWIVVFLLAGAWKTRTMDA